MPLRIVFFGNRHFFSDLFFAAFRDHPGCQVVAGVLAPQPQSAPPGLAIWTQRMMAKLVAPAQWRRLRLCTRLGWPWRIPAEAVLPSKELERLTPPQSWFDSAARPRDMRLLQPLSLREPGAEMVTLFRLLAADLFVSVAYTRIIGPELLALPRLGAFNFHPSRLPAYRGGSSIFFALRDGMEEVALTCHRMEAGIDTGTIAYQQKLGTPVRSRVADVYRTLVNQSLWMPGRLIDDALSGCIPSVPQSGEGSFFLAPRAEHLQVDWTKRAQLVESLVCACDGYAECSIAGAVLRILDGRVERHGTDVSPGTVVAVGPGGISVACGWRSVFTITEVAVTVPPPAHEPLRLKAGYVGQRLMIATGHCFAVRDTKCSQ